MNFNINTDINPKNLNLAINYLFNTENISHQAIIINELTKKIQSKEVLISLRKYIYSNSNKIKTYANSLDTCGTGGDGLKTLNISTTVAILLSSVGVPIAKHGNRAASSNSGSSDVINELGINNPSNSNEIHKQIKKKNFVYLNAPLFYPNLGKVAQVRNQLGFKTIFNFMGPTLNPLGAKYQLLGTVDKNSAEIMCKILSEIKLKNFKIFYSHEGLDEISLFSPTTFLIKDKSKIKKQTISQNYYKKYLNKVPKFSQIKGKDPGYNASRIFELFEGKKDTFRDMVLINSCHAMMLYKSKLKFQDCFDELSYALDNGNASRQLKLLQKK